jgi:AraC-like DNA-binding protein
MHTASDFLHKTPPPWLEIVRAGAYSAPKGKSFPSHVDAFWEIHYYRSGHIESVIGDDCIEVHPGMATIVPPRTPHGENAWTAYANYFVFINVPASVALPRVIFDDSDQSLMHVCAACAREFKSHTDPYQDVMLRTLASQLTVLLERVCRNQQCSDAERLVRSVEQLFEENYASPMMVQDVAREMGVSPSHVRAQFKLHRGETPMDCLQRIRLRHALAWLRTSNMTLEAIAHACGYDSASHLSRYVKRTTGKTPGDLRKA